MVRTSIVATCTSTFMAWGSVAAQDVAVDSMHTRIYVEPFQYVFGESLIGADTRVGKHVFVGLAFGYKQAAAPPEEGIEPVFAGYALLTDVAAVALPYYNGRMGRISIARRFGGPRRTRGELQVMFRRQEHPRLREVSTSTVAGYLTESSRSHSSVSLKALMERPIGSIRGRLGLTVSWFSGLGIRIRTTTVAQWTTIPGQGTVVEGPYVNEWVYPTVHLGMRFGLGWTRSDP